MQQNYDAKKERGQGLFMVNLKLTGHRALTYTGKQGNTRSRTHGLNKDLGAERSRKKAGDLVQLAAIINTNYLCNYVTTRFLST